METHYLSILELDKVRGLLARHTVSSMGRDRALELAPSSDVAHVQLLQELTAEALQLAELRPSLTAAGAADVTQLAHRAAQGGLLAPRELLQVKNTLDAALRWRTEMGKLAHRLPNLANLAALLTDDRPLKDAIADAIGDAEEVLDSASPALARIRSSLRTSQGRLATRLHDLITSAAYARYLQEPLVTQRNGRYVVPVKAEHRTDFKGIVHDQSASGATIFMEPLALVDLGNQVRQLELDEQEEVDRVLAALSAQVGDRADSLVATVAILGELDLTQSKARLAQAMRAARPEIHGFDHFGPGQAVVRLKDARHPLLAGSVVPISIELGVDYDVILITGPNTGGKTVALKTVGLLALMAQAGLHIPAAPESRLAVFDSIMADIGDEQSIEQSLSTFSSHISHVVDMLGTAGPRSLVLLDELGAGTDPLEGAALARAIIERLLEQRSFCIATTHYPELKAFAASRPRVENASVEFDPETLAPTYRLHVGLPGHSNALAIASRLGMPEQVVEAAREYLNPEHGELEDLLSSIRRERQSVDAESARLEALLVEQERLQHELRTALADIERRRREVVDGAREESEAMLAELRKEVARLRRRVSENAAASRRLVAAADQGARVLQPDEAREHLERIQALARQGTERLARGVRADAGPSSASPAVGDRPAGDTDAAAGLQAGRGTRNPKLETPSPDPLEVGAEIMVPALGAVARVQSIGRDEVELEVRGRRVRLPRYQLASATRASSSERRADERERERVLASGLERHAPMQLDLRGRRADDASQELDDYLHAAYMSGLRRVRVVHGRGTGAVRQAAHNLLARHPLVRSFALAGQREGGTGATDVELTDE